MSELARYIEAIDNHKPINLLAFTEHLRRVQLGHFTGSEHIMATSKVRSRFLVTISSQLRQEVMKIALPANATRGQAAQTFQSHKVRVNGSFMLAKYCGQHPFVIIIDAKGDFDSPCPLPSHVLVVENRNVFLDIETVFPEFIQKEPALEGALILLGNGGELANALHKSLLSSFKFISLFLDFDVGGMRIARSTRNLVQHDNVRYLLMERVMSTAANSGAIASLTTKEKEMIYALAKKEPFLHDFAAALLKVGYKAEQEAVLLY